VLPKERPQGDPQGSSDAGFDWAPSAIRPDQPANQGGQLDTELIGTWRATELPIND
jgi:hypothetical protein